MAFSLIPKEEKFFDILEEAAENAVQEIAPRITWHGAPFELRAFGFAERDPCASISGNGKPGRPR